MKSQGVLRGLLHLLAIALLVLATGCASGPRTSPNDPFEPFNRGVSDFNEGIDVTLIKPVATVYQTVTPRLVRTGVSNFFSNLGDLWSSVNNVFQLKPQEAVESFLRFCVNSVLGLGGLLDVASEMNIDRSREDLGRTLAYWGVPSGPYLVLPLLGPSTLRDALAIPADAVGNPLSYADGKTQTVLGAVRIIEVRANLLRASGVLDEAALDKYSFTRDVFLQRRNALKRPTDTLADDAPPPPPAEDPPPADKK
jgi:phospholipid-binding lipoprotein MlaA